MSDVERVRNLCKDRNIPIAQLEKDLGFGNGFLNPKKIRNISSERLVSIAAYLGLSVDELLGKEKEPAPQGSELTAAEEEVIRLYRAASAETRQAMLRLLRSLEADRLLQDDGAEDK